MKRHIIPLILVFWVSLSFAQSKISNYEYWFDGDYSNKTTSSVALTDNLNVSTLIPTTGLTDGVHTYNIRFKDNSGLWSSTLSQFFYKLPVASTIDRKIAEYEYWFDGDYANKTTSSVALTDNLNVSKLIPTTGLTDGVHTYNIRFKDDSGLWSSTLSQFFYKLPVASTIDRKIAEYEYWFDGDYSNKTTSSAAHTDNLNVSELIPTTSLADGVHTYNIRFKDDSGLWSSTLSQFFYKLPVASTIDRKIAQYEYWFDGNYSNKITSSVALTDNLNVSELIPTTSLADGVHTYNIRFKDDSGLWGSTLSQFFYKLPEASTIDRKIAQYEYWFDGDYSNKTMSSVALTDNLNVSELIPTTSLTDGVHTYNIRFKDDSGLWSSTLSQFFYKMPSGYYAENKITTYRYWLDDDFSDVIEQNLVVQAQNINFIDDIDLTHLTKGLHSVNFQFKDSLGMWSSVTTDVIEKLSLPIADFSYSTVFTCDSTVLTFIDKSIDGDKYAWDFGDGETDTIINPIHSYFVPGNYEVSLRITDTLTDQFSTKQVFISVLGNTQSSIDATVCDSYISPSGLYTWTNSGIYSDTIPNYMACDSIITVDLTVKHSTSSSINEIVCDTYTAPDGAVYTSSGIKTAIIPNVMGCDSTITINLTVNTVDVSVNQNSNILTALATPATYQWLDCNDNNNPLQDETNQIFTAIENGSYAVRITQNECTNTSICYDVTNVNIIENTFGKNIVVFPNPTKGLLYIDLGADFEEIEVLIQDVNGRAIEQLKYKNIQSFEINLSESPGIYFLTIRSENKKAIMRIVKN